MADKGLTDRLQFQQRSTDSCRLALSLCTVLCRECALLYALLPLSASGLAHHATAISNLFLKCFLMPFVSTSILQH